MMDLSELAIIRHLEAKVEKYRNVLELIKKEVEEEPGNMNEAYIKNSWIGEKAHVALMEEP